MILSLPVLLNTIVKSAIIVATAGWHLGKAAIVPLLVSAATIPLALLLSA
jgi:hypothetical protein